MSDDLDDEQLRVHITPDSFTLKGRVPIERRHSSILLAIIATYLGVNYDEVLSMVGP